MSTGQPQTEFHCICHSLRGCGVSDEGDAQSQKQGCGVVERHTDLSFHWGSLCGDWFPYLSLAFPQVAKAGHGELNNLSAAVIFLMAVTFRGEV